MSTHTVDEFSNHILLQGKLSASEASILHFTHTLLARVEQFASPNSGHIQALRVLWALYQRALQL